MSSVRLNEGHPYTAEFFPVTNIDEEYSLAYATIHPPFDLPRAKLLVMQEVVGGTRIEDFATTRTVTVLEMTRDLMDNTPEETLAILLYSLKYVISRLNEIENGTFEHRLREGEE
jgi:hypothetical protein